VALGLFLFIEAISALNFSLSLKTGAGTVLGGGWLKVVFGLTGLLCSGSSSES
jgi:hypothetical protein